MFWVVFGTAISYLIVNLPLVYSLTNVHGFSGISKLWGYAPNQFLFLAVFFPFATFCTLNALAILVGNVRGDISPSSKIRFTLDQWPAFLLAAIAVVAILSIAVYFSSSMSLDKLRTDYAMRAIDSMQMIDQRLQGVDASNRDSELEKIISDGKKESDSIVISDNDSDQVVSEKLQNLSPEAFLQVMQKPAYQLRSHIIDSTIQTLNVFQLFVALLIAALGLVGAYYCVIVAKEVGKDNQDLLLAVNSIFFALLYFAIYPICFNQYREQISRYIGSGNTVLQGFIAGVLIIIIVFWLNSQFSSYQVFSLSALLRYVPLVIIGTGYVSEVIRPEITEQLIGKNTNWGIQTIVIILTVVLGTLIISQIWSSD